MSTAENRTVGTSSFKKEIKHTPQIMSSIFDAMLGRRLMLYASASNPYLGVIDYVEGPVWVMDLCVGKYVHYAIFEEFTNTIYIYMGPLRAKPIIDIGQFYENKYLFAQVYSDKHENVCISICIK